MNIPLWSDNNPSVKEILLPTTAREWDDLSSDEKKRLWRYIESFLFKPQTGRAASYTFSNVSCDYEFYGHDQYENDRFAQTINLAIFALNERYKKQSYARNYLEDATYNNACHDFRMIFLEQKRDVVFELLSMFSNAMIAKDEERIWRKQNEGDEDFEARKQLEKWFRFDKFSSRLNKVLEEFGISYKLTRDGIIFADEPVIIERIYEPALKKLSAKKWDPVNRDLRDAFRALGDDKAGSGSGAITHALAALQGFLQILGHGTTGKGDTADLIAETTREGLIADDEFTKKIIKEMNSFWAKERQDKGDPHPKKAYATKKQAKLVVSLVMVFVDHVL